MFFISVAYYKYMNQSNIELKNAKIYQGFIKYVDTYLHLKLLRIVKVSNRNTCCDLYLNLISQIRKHIRINKINNKYKTAIACRFDFFVEDDKNTSDLIGYYKKYWRF